MTQLSALLLTALSLATPSETATVEGHVTSVRRDVIFVDLGRADGVSRESELTVRVGRKVTRLSVETLGERQLSARRVEGPAVRRGAAVATPASTAPAPAAPTRPLARVAAPKPASKEVVAARWADPRLRSPPLVPSPERRSADEEAGVRLSGDITATYFGAFDTAPKPLDLHSVRLRSRLRVEGMLDDRLDWAHDVSGRYDAGTSLSSRHGAGARPYYDLRLARLRYRSAGDVQLHETGPGAFSAAIGRLWLPFVASTGRLDGGEARISLGDGWSAGAHGGLAPGALDAGFSADVGVGGAHVAWRQRGDRWRASASAVATARSDRGAFDRVDVGLTGSLSLDRDLDLRAHLVLTALGDAPAGAPPASVSRALLAVRARPVDWLTLNAHWAHLADVTTGRVRETTWLQARLDPHRLLSVSLSGVAGFGDGEASEQLGAGIRMVARTTPLVDGRVSASYRFMRSPATDTHVVHVDAAFPLLDVVEIGGGYGFSTFESRLLGDREDEHRFDARADLLLPGPWRAGLLTSVGVGDQPTRANLAATLSWSF